MSIRKIAVMLTSWALIACQGNKGNQERTQAPTGPQDVGVLLDHSNESEVAAILAEHPRARVRRLSSKHGMYEIFGVSLGEVKRLAPAAEASGNQYYLFKPQSVPAPGGLGVDGLERCVEASVHPTAVASVVEPAGSENSFTIELGGKVKVFAGASQPHPEHPSALKSALVLIPPGGSAIAQSVTHGQELEVTPDALGVYQIYLVVQDARNVCALDMVRFIATANRPLQSVADTLQLDVDRIGHLATVSAKESWTRSQGEGVTIAIIDTGVNYNHPLLNANIALNPRERGANGADDDENGIVDDELGYDFINSDVFPYDDDGHGTHVAGLAAARQMGMAQKAKILAVKAMTSVGGDAGSIAAAMVYSVDRGAKVINMSLGMQGPAPHPLMVRAMDYAKQNGVLVVIASGNGDMQTGLGFDIDSQPVWPASLTHDNILTVAASDAINPLTPYSNFGKVGVDITAPGGFGRHPIISCAFENPAGQPLAGMSGTSMASPIVAGIAAQVWSLRPAATAQEIRELLMQAGPEVASLKDVTVSGRHLNALTAVNLIGPANALF